MLLGDFISADVIKKPIKLLYSVKWLALGRTSSGRNRANIDIDTDPAVRLVGTADE